LFFSLDKKTVRAQARPNIPFLPFFHRRFASANIGDAAAPDNGGALMFPMVADRAVRHRVFVTPPAYRFKVRRDPSRRNRPYS
jgi:hypothetical protein